MPTNDVAAPTLQEVDQRAARAKASVLSRVELLKHKFTDATHKLDLPARITQHPLAAVGIAFVLGALAGLGRTKPPPLGAPAPSSFKNAAVAALAAFGLRVVKKIALTQLVHLAKQRTAPSPS